MRQIQCIALICLFSLAGGCATLLRGTAQTISFDTNPQGSTVAIDGQTLTTPTSISLARRKVYNVVISKPAYRTIEFKLEPQYDGLSLIGNLLLPGGSVGLVLDSTDGADKRFYEMAVVDMIPKTPEADTVLVLKNFKGHLLTDEQYALAVLADRRDKSQFFAGQP